jgi:hypothetical protein
MAFSSFSGPIRSGTVREGALENMGLVALVQSYSSGDLTGRTTAASPYDVLAFIIPQGSQIVDITVDQIVAATAGTTTVSVGNASGGAQLMAAVATTAGGRFRGTATATTQLAWQTSTTADTTVYVRLAVGTATLTAGQFIVTVTYVQRAPNGAQVPVSA